MCITKQVFKYQSKNQDLGETLKKLGLSINCSMVNANIRLVCHELGITNLNISWFDMTLGIGKTLYHKLV